VGGNLVRHTVMRMHAAVAMVVVMALIVAGVAVAVGHVESLAVAVEAVCCLKGSIRFPDSTKHVETRP
jgi:hypothetical protein